ncbi:hypothetical protein MARPU_03040 [Marichromatium purpuratum 984]|uniref:Uncharacterized protein n=1 Tax=Marichromatium purpuratum 984 TaxID=765910 RepID=W0E8I3_MARPU|nr:hypothetical protein MARPU_03040 [Marichromatium purpuratum 984]
MTDNDATRGPAGRLRGSADRHDERRLDQQAEGGRGRPVDALTPIDSTARDGPDRVLAMAWPAPWRYSARDAEPGDSTRASDQPCLWTQANIDTR